MTDYGAAMRILREKRQAIEAIRKEMRLTQAAATPQRVEDYELAGPFGPVRLSDLFGAKSDLFVIHNMGRRCSSCTMWADGFSGVYHHLADRAAFVVSSPDPVEVQQAFAAERGWRFPMVSHAGTTFADDMGYRRKEGWWPGVSVFQKRQGELVRVSDATFGPGDDFATAWHFFDLLPEGLAGWDCKFRYTTAAAERAN